MPPSTEPCSACTTTTPTVGGTRTAADTLTSPLLACTTAGAGTCTIANVPFGAYWVVETTTPDGYTTASDQAAVISSATSSVTLRFVDPRIILNPTITTAQSFVPNDSATVAVANTQGALAGNVVFKLYDNATCSGTPLYDSGNVSIASGSGGDATRTVSSANTTAYTVSTTLLVAGDLHERPTVATATSPASATTSIRQHLHQQQQHRPLEVEAPRSSNPRQANETAPRHAPRRGAAGSVPRTFPVVSSRGSGRAQSRAVPCSA